MGFSCLSSSSSSGNPRKRQSHGGNAQIKVDQEGGTGPSAQHGRERKKVCRRWPRLFGCCGPPQTKIKTRKLQETGKGVFLCWLGPALHTHTFTIFHVHIPDLFLSEMMEPHGIRNEHRGAGGWPALARAPIYLSIYIFIYKTPFFLSFPLLPSYILS